MSVLMPVVYHAASRALVRMGQDYAPLSTARPAVLRLLAASVAGSAPGVGAGLLPTSFAPLHRPTSVATFVSASASGGSPCALRYLTAAISAAVANVPSATRPTPAQLTLSSPSARESTGSAATTPAMMKPSTSLRKARCVGVRLSCARALAKTPMLLLLHLLSRTLVRFADELHFAEQVLQALRQRQRLIGRRICMRLALALRQRLLHRLDLVPQLSDYIGGMVVMHTRLLIPIEHGAVVH